MLSYSDNVSEIGYDSRLVLALSKADIITIGALTRCSRADLLTIPGFGPKAYDKAVAMLGERAFEGRLSITGKDCQEIARFVAAKIIQMDAPSLGTRRTLTSSLTEILGRMRRVELAITAHTKALRTNSQATQRVARDLEGYTTIKTKKKRLSK